MKNPIRPLLPFRRVVSVACRECFTWWNPKMLVVLFCREIVLSRQVLVGFGAGEDKHPRLAKASLSRWKSIDVRVVRHVVV